MLRLCRPSRRRWRRRKFESSTSTQNQHTEPAHCTCHHCTCHQREKPSLTSVVLPASRNPAELAGPARPAAGTTLRTGRPDRRYLDGVGNTDAWLRRVALNRLRARLAARIGGAQVPGRRTRPASTGRGRPRARRDRHRAWRSSIPTSAESGPAPPGRPRHGPIADELGIPKDRGQPLAGWLRLRPHQRGGRPMFNVLAMGRRFESDLIRLRTREGIKVAKAKGRPGPSEPNQASREAFAFRECSRHCLHPRASWSHQRRGKPLAAREDRRRHRPAHGVAFAGWRLPQLRSRGQCSDWTGAVRSRYRLARYRKVRATNCMQGFPSRRVCSYGSSCPGTITFRDGLWHLVREKAAS